MLIYPVKTTRVQPSAQSYGASWNDKAGNLHFVLQERVKHESIVKSFIGGLSSFIPGSSSKAAASSVNAPRKTSFSGSNESLHAPTGQQLAGQVRRDEFKLDGNTSRNSMNPLTDGVSGVDMRDNSQKLNIDAIITYNPDGTPFQPTQEPGTRNINTPTNKVAIVQHSAEGPPPIQVVGTSDADLNVTSQKPPKVATGSKLATHSQTIYPPSMQVPPANAMMNGSSNPSSINSTPISSSRPCLNSLTGESPTAGVETTNLIDDYPYRVLLRCPTHKADYIVAINDTFTGIRNDWNFVESQLKLRLDFLMETQTPPTKSETLDVNSNDQTSRMSDEQIDNSLLKHFRDLTEGAFDPKTATQLNDMQLYREQYLPYFHSHLKHDSVLGVYKTKIIFYGKKALSHDERGTLIVTKNTIMYLRDIDQTKMRGSLSPYNMSGIPSMENSQSVHIKEMTADIKDSYLFKFVIPMYSIKSTEILPHGSLLKGDFLHVITSEKKYIFSVKAPFQQELHMAIQILCDASIQRVLQSVEQSAARSTMPGAEFEKLIGGDLSSVSETSKGFGALSMEKSKQKVNKKDDGLPSPTKSKAFDFDTRKLSSTNLQSLGGSKSDLFKPKDTQPQQMQSDELDDDLNNENSDEDDIPEFAVDGDFTTETKTSPQKDNQNIPKENLQTPKRQRKVSISMESGIPDNANYDEVTIGVYGKISTYGLKTLDEVFFRNKCKEFRQLASLPFPEKILTIDIKTKLPLGKINVHGMFILSDRFLTFVGYKGTHTITKESFLAKEEDPSVLLVIPFTHIISVVQQASRSKSLVPGGNASKISSIFSFASPLTITTKSKSIYTLYFADSNSRDQSYESIMASLKAVNFKNNVDFIVGKRNPSYLVALEEYLSASTSNNVEASKPPTVPTIVEPKVRLNFANRSQLSVLDVGGASSSSQWSLSSDTNRNSHTSSAPTSAKQLAANGSGTTSGLQYELIANGKAFTISNSLPASSRKTTFDFRVKPFFETLENETYWDSYFDVYGKDVCTTRDLPTLRLLLIKTLGVPFKYKADFWMLSSGAWYAPPPQGYYLHLVTSHSIESAFAEEIEKDIRRSMPGHFAYRCPEGIDSLRRVLTAYSWRNPSVGYAQALNIITAYLLLHLKEEDAFWMLCNIVENHLPDYYSTTLAGGVIDQSVLNVLVHNNLPNLHKHLGNINMELSTITVPWFLCLFLATVEMDIGLTFLDIFFLEGPRAIFWISLSILQVNEAQLLATNDDDQAMRVIKNFFNRLCDTSAYAVPTDADANSSNGSETNLADLNKPNNYDEDDDDILDLDDLSATKRRQSSTTDIDPTTAPVFEKKSSDMSVSSTGSVSSAKTPQRTESVKQKAQTKEAQAKEKSIQSFSLLESLATNSALPKVSKLIDVDSSKLTGADLLQHLLRVAYVFFEPVVNTKTIDDIRRKCRHDVAFKLEDSNKKNQVRNFSEKVSLNVHELSVIYDNIQTAIISHDSGYDVSSARFGDDNEMNYKQEGLLREYVIKLGGWGLNSEDIDELIKNENSMFGEAYFKYDSKTTSRQQINLADFRDIIQRISPWRLKISSQTSDINNGQDAVSNKTKMAVENLSLVDRIYLYCVVRNNYLFTGNKDSLTSSEANAMSSLTKNGNKATNYFLNFTTVAHVLNTISRQPSNNKLRFFFDIHDIDGDGFLNEREVLDLIKSLLELKSTYTSFFELEPNLIPQLSDKNEGGNSLDLRAGTPLTASHSSLSAMNERSKDASASGQQAIKNARVSEDSSQGATSEHSTISAVLSVGTGLFAAIGRSITTTPSNAIADGNKSSENVTEIPSIESKDQRNGGSARPRRASLHRLSFSSISSNRNSVASMDEALSPTTSIGSDVDIYEGSEAFLRAISMFEKSILGNLSLPNRDSFPIKEEGTGSEIMGQEPSHSSSKTEIKVSFQDFLLNILSHSSFTKFFEQNSPIREYEF